MAHLAITHLQKSYGSHLALKDINLDIPSGAFFTLLGPSGCGKTTLLRAIAGFHQQDAGDIVLDGQSIAHLGANQRQVGMVFQDYAVFPHLSVFDNVAFGLVQQKIAKPEIERRVKDILQTVQLNDFAQRMPHQLSGGQQQRVGLARALVTRPKVLLMDEPLSNLDAKLRIDLRRDIRALQQSLGITTVYVTHDQEEALSISDYICVMHDGVVQQVGTPWQIYTQAANRFVASFVGSNQFLPLDIDPLTGNAHLLGQALTVPAQVSAYGKTSGTGIAATCVAAIRPEHWQLHLTTHTAASASAEPTWHSAGTVQQLMFTGREIQLSVALNPHTVVDVLCAPSPQTVALRVGSTIHLSIEPSKIQFYATGDTGVLLA